MGRDICKIIVRQTDTMRGTERKLATDRQSGFNKERE